MEGLKVKVKVVKAHQDPAMNERLSQLVADFVSSESPELNKLGSHVTNTIGGKAILLLYLTEKQEEKASIIVSFIYKGKTKLLPWWE